MSGIGLHSGNSVSMTLRPAPPDSGVRFKRVDLDGAPEIPARLEHVHETKRSTTLARGNVRIHTVEHILAALSGAGVDNATIELDANEPPIGDGSARPYMKLIEEAGFELQTAPKSVFTLSEPIEFELGESIVSAFPNDRLKITCTNADRAGRFTQVKSSDITPTTWRDDIAHARTFCFYEEIEYLIHNGLIKGGSLENAVVIRDDVVLTTEPLRYPDEFVRHKILDIVGDLALIGRPLHAHVIAVRPGHASNCELAKRVLQQIRKPVEAAQTFSPPANEVKRPAPEPPKKPEASAASEVLPSVMDVNDIKRLLPHRYPFLMVDRVTRIEGQRIEAVKNVSINEPYFQGHFPGHPIMPGVLQLEAIAQVAGILTLTLGKTSGKLAFFMSAESVKFRKPVHPGDQLVIDVELTKTRKNIGRAKGACLVNGEIVSQADVTFMLRDR